MIRIASAPCIAFFLSMLVSPIAGQQNESAKTEGLKFSIKSEKDRYFVAEPFQLAIEVSNPTDRTIEVPSLIADGYSLSLRDLDDENPKDELQIEGEGLIERPSDIITVEPGQTKTIALRGSGFKQVPAEGCPKPGRWAIKYTYHGSRWPDPQWHLNEIKIECVAQPLVFSEGTPEQIRTLVQQIKLVGISSSRPGWTDVSHNDSMKRLLELGDAAVPALLANINNYERQLPIMELMGELGVESAVPEMISALELRDTLRDSLIIAKLAEITKLEDGYRFHRRWFDPGVRESALRAYQEWRGKYQSSRVKKKQPAK
ncbi:MAG: hypothetical protein ABL888_07900 [Pirellulaceae bacterium]